MANFVVIPILSHNDETVKVNVQNIVDVRIINIGKKAEIPGRNENWYVQVIMLPGKYYLLRSEHAPYATKNEALAARDQFLSSLN